jgi:hypothetical protein
MPAVVAALILLARGTHMSDQAGPSTEQSLQGWGNTGMY